MTDKDRHITTKRVEILNYSNGHLLTNRVVDELLVPLGNVEELQYILLTSLSSEINTNTLSYDYSYFLIKYSSNESMIFFFLNFVLVVLVSF